MMADHKIQVWFGTSQISLISKFEPGEFDALVRQIAAGGTVE